MQQYGGPGQRPQTQPLSQAVLRMPPSAPVQVLPAAEGMALCSAAAAGTTPPRPLPPDRQQRACGCR